MTLALTCIAYLVILCLILSGAYLYCILGHTLSDTEWCKWFRTPPRMLSHTEAHKLSHTQYDIWDSDAGASAGGKNKNKIYEKL